MTLLSFFMLISIGYILHITWQAARTDSNINYQHPQTVWWFLSWGFFIAAWDELLRLHETLDRQIHKLLGVKPTHITDHLDDLFVAMYGLAGILILLFYFKEIIKFISVWRYFLGAAVMGSLSVIVDVLCADKPFLKLFTEDPDRLQLTIDILDIVEESFKIFSEIFFVGLVVAIYKIQIGRSKA